MIRLSIRVKAVFEVCLALVNPVTFHYLNYLNLLKYVKYISLDILFINIITSFSISLVLSLQVVKEFLYLNAVHLVSSMLAISFIRELSPLLTSIVVIGKIGSLYTSELATMVATEQIDSLFVLGIDPISYLILPRVIALLLTLPLLNLFSVFTSFISSSFICFVLYDINPTFFFTYLFYSNIYFDFLKSFFKMIVFGLSISIISCVWGITSSSSSQGVGLSTTSSVVTSLFCIFILNFVLSYFLFDNVSSSFAFF
uniref:Uncharacterized protein n=1 Tax=Vertebrata lanosa TaxID=1261582 RepID=A0A0B5W3P0_9FLOR|nr:hypothetical protein [Vertebrata lanosa]AJH66025.1 hypothetical protein [Vertebrata lanosa]